MVVTIEVDVEGSGAGGEAGPCSILEANRIANERAKTGSDVCVVLKPGVYELDAPLVIENTGTRLGGQTITWKAERPDTVFLTGARTVDSWHLHDAKKGIWRASVPEGADFEALWVGGHKKRIASTQFNPRGLRYANDHLVVDPEYFYIAELRAAKKLSAYIRSYGIWRVSEHRISRMDEGQNHLFLDDPFQVDRYIVDAINRVNYLSLRRKTMHRPEKIALANSYNFLNEPDEWYLDVDESQLYYIPSEAGFGEKMVAGYSTTDSLIQLTGTRENPISNIVIEDLHLRYTDGVFGYNYGPSYNAAAPKPHMGAIHVSAGENIRIQRCSFKHLGSTALWFDLCSRNVRIVGNAFQEVRGKAIHFIQSDVDTIAEQTKKADSRYADKYHRDVRIENNYIRDIRDPLAINTTELIDELAVIHNDIAETDGFAIKVNWWKNFVRDYAGSVEYGWNRVARGGRLEDTGLIYVSATNKRPCSIHHNYADATGIHRGSHAYYLYISAETVDFYENVSVNPYKERLIALSSRIPFFSLNIGAWLTFVDSEGSAAHDNWTESARIVDVSLRKWRFSRSRRNRVYDNSVVERGLPEEEWPEAAQEVIRHAGLEKDFEFIKGFLNLDVDLQSSSP